MPKKLEFFYDCSSPWTYLAFSKIEEVALRHDAQLIWRPILVGGLFNTVNPSVYEGRAKPVPVKAKYYVKDLRDWAKFYGLKIGNPTVFPVNSVKAMRGAFVADKDISQDDVLREIVVEVGLDEKEFFTKIASDEYKARLRANVEELIARGGFGSPTMFVEGSMFFGNDRLPLVEHELAVGVGGALDKGSAGTT